MIAKDILRRAEGYKGELEIRLPDFEASVEIRFKQMTSKDLNRKPIFRDEEGNEVVRRYIGESRHLEWRQRENDEPAVGQIKAYQVITTKNGREKEVEVKPFERTTRLEIKKIAFASIKDNFLIERTYELWGEDEKLYHIAKYLQEKKAVGLCAVVMARGYDTQFLGILQPRFIENENKFGLLLFLAKKQLIFEHLLEINVKTKKKAEQPKSLEIVDMFLGSEAKV